MTLTTLNVRFGATTRRGMLTVVRNVTLEDRVTTLERDLRDHAKTLSSIINKLTVLEEAEHKRLVIEARVEERAIARGEKLDKLEKDVGQWREELKEDIAGLRGVGTKILWIIATAVIGTAVAFLLGGGLVP